MSFESMKPSIDQTRLFIFAEIAAIESDIAGIRTDIKVIGESLGRIETINAEMDQTLGRMENDLAICAARVEARSRK